MGRKHVHFDAKGHLVSADGANHESRFSKGRNPEVITGTGLHAVRAKLSEAEPEPFALKGDDWFPVADSSTPLSWSKILDLVALEQQRLADCVADISAGRTRSPLPESERLDLVLGITCHAVYHAGQIQLIKRLQTS